MDQIRTELVRIESYSHVDLGIREAINDFFDRENIQSFVKTGIEKLQNIGIFLVQIFIGLVLSYVFVMERTKIAEYLSSIRSSHFAFLYSEYSIIFSKIERAFGLVFKAQAIIALVNAVLTATGLLIIGALLGPGGEPFPYIITLSTIVFIMGFIPVLGTIISSIPILIIGYTYGGPGVVVGILAMVAVVHAVEAYYLNPKIVSSYMEFPVFVTFVILLVSESLFGLVGLLIGVPLFSILIDLFRDLDRAIGHIKIAHERLLAAQRETKASIESGIRLSRSGRRGE
ncbi:MAG TPA: AI-2E family transporter [bacterium]|nr:AI-2E family transporter [bacterium]